MTDHIIVGNGVAAVNAVEGIRDAGDDGNIIIISEEQHPAYSRPLISYLLGEKVDNEAMTYRGEEFYERNEVEVRYNQRAAKINTGDKTVETEDGSQIPYDDLLIATGGSPIKPPVENGNQDGVFTFTKWSDVNEIRKYIKNKDAKSAAIVGGGLIGLKTAEALINRGIEVNIIELMDKILSATFDKTASSLMESHLRSMGCNLHTGTTVERIIGKEGVSGVLLKNGEKIEVDMVVFAIGVSPNVEVAECEGIEIKKGIVVNSSMKTSKKDVYAAGDVAEIPDILAGDRKPIAIWPNASRQGYIAGMNMGGKDEAYEGSFAMNSVKIKDLATISVGITDPEDDQYEILAEVDEENGAYKKAVIDENKLVGVIFVKNVDRAGIYTGLIRKGINVTSFKKDLLDPNFGLIDLPEDYRRTLLSGEGMKL